MTPRAAGAAFLLASIAAAGGDGPEPEDRPLREGDAAAVALSEEYRLGRQYPYRDGSSVVYLHGAGQPTLVCAPLNVCLIELEAGERIVEGGVHIGDSVRWSVLPAVGAAETTTLALKPVDAGLETTMAIITDRRTYHLRLVSRASDYMASIGFAYPDALAAAWRAYHDRQRDRAADGTLPETGEALADLDFGYEVSDCGGCAWRPLRVYSDGMRTVIELPARAQREELPVLLVLDGGAEALANYRVVGGRRYVVDGVFGEAVLVAGVGRRQARVSIRREGA